MNIALMLTSVLALSFFIAYLYTARQLRLTTQSLAETTLLYLSLVEPATDSDIEKDERHKESFIKFLSDSRDWAFDYIEKTQKTISKFIDEVEPEIEYYKEYGVVIEGVIPPHDKALKKISKEISELKSLLPEEASE